MPSVEVAYEDLQEQWSQVWAQGGKARASLLELFRVRFSYNSGRIENQAITYHDTRDVFERGEVRGYFGDTRTLFEIQNLRACSEFLEERLASSGDSAGLVIDERLVLDTHCLLTQGTYDAKRWGAGERPGEYKKGDYVVGVSDAGLPAAEVPAAMAELLGELQACTRSNVLTVAAYFHASFEFLHPFADGNGRVGRALLNHLLLAYGHMPVVVFDEDKMAYYAALDAWDSEADLEPMKAFLRAEAVKTWQGKIAKGKAGD